MKAMLIAGEWVKEIEITEIVSTINYPTDLAILDPSNIHADHPTQNPSPVCFRFSRMEGETAIYEPER
jgi:hypothetical protein